MIRARCLTRAALSASRTDELWAKTSASAPRRRWYQKRGQWQHNDRKNLGGVAGRNWHSRRDYRRGIGRAKWCAAKARGRRQELAGGGARIGRAALGRDQDRSADDRRDQRSDGSKRRQSHGGRADDPPGR